MFLRLLQFSLIFGLLFLGNVADSHAQTLPDFSSIKVDELTDEQVESLFRRASAMGYSQADIFALAKQQGLSTEELTKLGERFEQSKSARTARGTASPVDNARLRRFYTDSLKSLSKRETDIFGLDFFSRNSPFLTFQPSINKPTPKDYVLGVGDEVFIDIYGSSEQYYQSSINPDGNIIIENVGPIKLSGLTIGESKEKIKSRLSVYYTGLKSKNPTSFLDVSLGQTRSIRVSIVGQVELPGTYNLTAFSTALSALYVSGGISEEGTLREVKVVRNGELLATLDLYAFLMTGEVKNNVVLEDTDVVIVGPYTNRVTLQGAVKTSAKFELRDGETLSDLLQYAGGFSEEAYEKKINLVRNKGGEKVVADVFEEQYGLFTAMAGDVYTVDEILDRFSNRVIIKGAVYRPGDYAITSTLSVKELVEKADGIRADAFLERAYITRTTEDLNTETISFNLRDILNGSVKDINLQREDVLNILSSNDLQGERYVEISGEVNKPGIFPFAEGMTVEDLLLMAQGFKQSATGIRAEITRRITDEAQTAYDLSDVIILDLDKSLETESEKSELLPFDHVIIRRNPNFQFQRFAAVEGQVNYPGQYAIKNYGERISDLIERSGGLNPYAYVQGATLVRKTEFFEEPTEDQRQVDDLLKLRQKLLDEPESLTESELFLLSRIEQELQLLEDEDKTNENLSDFAKRERLQEILQRNSLLGDVQLKQAEAIGIDLAKIISSPGSAEDLLLEEGDVLIIPKKVETVRLRGKLLYPTTVRYEEGKSLKYFIDNAGGFDNRAKRSRTYVVYANGRVAKTRRFLFFRSYPKAAPGAEIIVPAKPIKPTLGPQELIGITSGLATLALLLSQINF
jgi:protein involved in polysaccharide export with SLBB domain